MHRPRHGLILGKFLPPHGGHLRLIETARREVEQLTILVCTLQRESIPGAIRADWMTELCPDARVVHVEDENPSFPNEHPDFWAIWTETIRRHTDAPVDVLFTSEEYGEELARCIGARHRPVDPGRSVTPVSGSEIRNDPFGNWQYIPRVVRPWFVRRVVLTGSECTGKTTLAGTLARHYQTVISSEYGRQYVDEVGSIGAADVEAIARGQMASEDAAAREANGVVIHDTDLLSTIVYGRHYFGEIPSWIDEELQRRRADLYLLAGIDVPWVSDGLQRDRGHMREEMQELFRDALRSRGLTWVELRGSVEKRMRVAVAEIDRMLEKGGYMRHPRGH